MTTLAETTLTLEDVERSVPFGVALACTWKRASVQSARVALVEVVVGARRGFILARLEDLQHVLQAMVRAAEASEILVLEVMRLLALDGTVVVPLSALSLSNANRLRVSALGTLGDA